LKTIIDTAKSIKRSDTVILLFVHRVFYFSHSVLDLPVLLLGRS